MLIWRILATRHESLTTLIFDRPFLDEYASFFAKSRVVSYYLDCLFQFGAFGHSSGPKLEWDREWLGVGLARLSVL